MPRKPERPRVRVRKKGTLAPASPRCAGCEAGEAGRRGWREAPGAERGVALGAGGLERGR